MEVIDGRIGRILYGFIFCIVLPVVLILWAKFFVVSLPIGDWEPAGHVFLLFGSWLMLAGMWNLFRHGDGLPMNAYPPKRYVTQGAYALFRHPIYTGFCAGVAGVSILAGSSTGLYVITPIMILMCLALVLGFERPDLEARFGKRYHPVLFGLPSGSKDFPSWRDRFAALVTAFLPWLVLYEVVIFIGVLPGALNTVLAFEKRANVVEWMEIPYILTYPWVVMIPFIVRSRQHLRGFVSNVWYLTAAGIFLQLTLPLYAEPRSFQSMTLLGQLIQWEREFDGPAGAFPSFHVIWALLANAEWSKSFPKWRLVFKSAAASIIASCFAVGAHSILDIAAGIIVFLIVSRRRSLWIFLNRLSETLANTWASITFGKLRVINHSAFAGIAAVVGVLTAGAFSIPPSVLLIVMISCLVGGMVWGQLVEGSTVLMRPFGYYGALLGGIIGVLLSGIFLDFPVMTTFAALALASPITQAFGRLRCLVQGCCHGKPVASGGIMYTNPRSRVCKSPALRGVQLHNTQLYSILSNVAIFLLLGRICYSGAPASAVAGFYFILTGIARFIEEAYRGEVQTVVVKGLRLYQWLSVGSVLMGIVLTCIRSGPCPAFITDVPLDLVMVAFGSGLVWSFGMGMDFPESSFPFSKLSS